MDNYRASVEEKKMAWELAGLRLGYEKKSLLEVEERLDLVVVGDPLGVYCRAWKWGEVHHVAFQEKHKASLEVVSGCVKQLVASEDPKKPFSDQKLVDMLKADGVTIARRTVAKYREAMNILPSSKRKRGW